MELFKNNTGSCEQYGQTNNQIMNKVHAFIALLFRPLKVNNLANDFFKNFSLGESVPQFMTKRSGQSKKWLFACVICEEFREFCTSKRLKYNHKFIKNTSRSRVFSK
jgi:hypothetical protein